MKKTVVAVTAVTLAVLFGGVSSLFAQKVDAQQIQDQAFVSRIMAQPQVGLTCKFAWRSVAMVTPMLEGSESGFPKEQEKAYPANGTFLGYVHTENQTNYVLVSESVWRELAVPTYQGTIIDNVTFKTEKGNVFSSKTLEVNHYQMDGKNYAVIAFPFQEGARK